MLTVIRNDNGEIIVACEWRKVNPQGQYDKDGKLIWINNVEVSKQYQNNGILYKLIKKITDEMPEIEYAYFKRRKYNNRIRGYTRNQWLRLIKEREYEMA